MRYLIALLAVVACGTSTTAPGVQACDAPGYIRTIEHVDTLTDGSVRTILGEEAEPADCEPGAGDCVCLDRWLE